MVEPVDFGSEPEDYTTEDTEGLTPSDVEDLHPWHPFRVAVLRDFSLRIDGNEDGERPERFGFTDGITITQRGDPGPA